MCSYKAVRLWASGELEACVEPAVWENLLFISSAPPLSCPPGHPLLLQWWIKQETRVCYVCADYLCFKWSSRHVRLRLQVAPWLVTHILTRRSPGECQMAFEYFAPLKSFHAVNRPSIQEKEVNWALSSALHGQGEKREKERIPYWVGGCCWWTF